MKPLWFIFLFLQVLVNFELSWTQIVKTCEIGVPHPHLYIAGVLSGGEAIKAGQKLRFLCGADYKLDGSEEIECLQTGQWSATFATCSVKTCEIGVPHPHLYIAGIPSAGEAIKAGHKLRFFCGTDYKLDGSEEIECLQTGQWNVTFPTCSVPSGCSAPPPLADGDIKLTTRSDSQYQQGERVEYICQNKYTMDGGPFKTCDNGKWKGEIRCLKPCIVNQQIMDAHYIQHAYGVWNTLYAPHKDHVTFACKRGRRHDGSVPMRAQCNDGVMTFPTCL